MLTRSLKLFIRGPVWAVAGAVSVFSSVIATVELVSGAPAARVLAFVCAALAALLVAAFWTFHKTQVGAKERENELPNAIERMVLKGIDRIDTMLAAHRENPNEIHPWPEQVDEAEDFFEEARQVIIEGGRPTLLHDFGEALNESRRQAFAKDDEKFQKMIKREKDGESVSNFEKMTVWAGPIERRAVTEMEAILRGLRAVRGELAD